MERLKSRKFWVLIANAGLLIAKAFGLDIDAQSLLQFTGLSGAYMIGQGIADAGSDKRKGRAGNALGGS